LRAAWKVIFSRQALAIRWIQAMCWNANSTKIVGKGRTVAQAKLSEKGAASIVLHSFRHTNGMAMDSLGICIKFATIFQAVAVLYN
jgi:hypothetical protein